MNEDTEISSAENGKCSGTSSSTYVVDHTSILVQPL